MGTTWRQAIDQLYRKRVVYGRTGELTWQTNYMGRLRQLPMGKGVTTAQVLNALQKYERDTVSSREVYCLYADICKMVDLPSTEALISIDGSKLTKLELPSD